MKRFCKDLRGHVGPELPPIMLLDERYSTKVVTLALRDISKARIASHKQDKLDMMCAAKILQGALSSLAALDRTTIG